MDMRLVSILEELEIRQVSFSKYGNGYETLLAERLGLVTETLPIPTEGGGYAIA